MLSTKKHMMASASPSSFRREESAEERREEYGEERSVVSLLSDDTLVVMLRCFSTRELLTSAALVCRRWHRICKQYLVYELVPSAYNAIDKPWGHMTGKKLFQLAVSHSSSLERLSLTNLRCLTSSDDVISLLSQLPKLKDLAIVSCPLLTSDLEAIASQLPSQLVSLDLHADHFAASSCHECAFVSPLHIEDSVLNAIQQRCSQLQRLNLDSCSNITMQGLGKLLQANQFLTSLDLHSHALGWKEVAIIFDSCKFLRHFSLVSPLLAESLNILGEDPEERFPRRRYSRNTDEQTAAACALPIQLPRDLTSLRLYSSPHRSIPLELAPPLLGALRQSGTQLLQLHAHRVYNTTWQTIQTWCPNLKLLDLSHNKHESHHLTGVESLVLCGLIKMLKQLEYIALPAATDAILRQLGDHCPKLKELRFEGYGRTTAPTYFLGVTDAGVVAVAEGCPDLRVLSLAGCRKITVHSVRAIAYYCRKLKVLILSHCRGIRDNSVTAMLPRLSTTLVLLDLVGCKISLASLQAILQYANVTTLRVVAVKLPANKVQAISNHTSHPRLEIGVRTSSMNSTWDGFYNAVPFL